VAGFTVSGDPDEVDRAFADADRAFEEAGAKAPPRRITSFWYAIGEDGARRLHDYAYAYLKVFGDAPARALAATARVHSEDVLLATLDALEACGCQELLLVPTSTDVALLERTVSLLERRG
jgi:hypothetical protein